MKDLRDVISILKRPVKKYTKPGTRYLYVKGSDVIQQLNDAFDCQWSSEVVSVEEKYSFVLVHLRLRAVMDGQVVSHDGFGSAPVMKKRGTEEVIDIGNNYKSAYTIALKKAAEQFGVGLGDEDEDVQTAPPPVQRDTMPAARPPVSRQQAGEAVKKFANPTTAPTAGMKPRPAPLTPPTSATATAPAVRPAMNGFVKPSANELATQVQVEALRNLLKNVVKPPVGEEVLIKKALGETTNKAKFDDLTRGEATKVIIFAQPPDRD